MKGLIILIFSIAFIDVAHANLADEYWARRDQRATAKNEKDSAEAYRGAVRFLERYAKAKIVSGPEIRPNSSLEDYFYQMSNGKICRFTVAGARTMAVPYYYLSTIGCQ